MSTQKERWILSALVCVSLAMSGCGGAEKNTAKTTPDDETVEQTGEATPLQWYNHYMAEAGIAISEGRDADALDSYIEAADALEETGEITVKLADAHYEAAALAYQRMEKDLAIEQYQIAVDIYVRFSGNSQLKAAVALTNMGSAYKEKTNRDKARNCWQQALQIYKNSPDTGQNNIHRQKVEQNLRDLAEGF